MCAAVFLQATRGRRAEVETRVYYNVGRENIEMVYYNVAGSDAEAGPSEEAEYHPYEEIDLQRDAEAGPSEETEYHPYEDIDLQRDAEAGPSEETVYEVDL